jgi:antibiotic biosynthesis monooxygenase (ABM) superfamily enzyme
MLIMRFSDKRSLRAWNDSDERKALTSAASEFSEPAYEEASSLETWFTIPGLGAVRPPPRWKMALVTTPAAYVLIMAILLALSPVVESWPFAVLNAVVTVLMVVLLTYVAMPLLTRVLRPWLYPTGTRRRRPPGKRGRRCRESLASEAQHRAVPPRREPLRSRRRRAQPVDDPPVIPTRCILQCI